MVRGKYFQSNRKTRIYLDAIGDLIGPHGLSALLRLAGMHKWADELPPYTDELQIDFADISTLREKLELMYGPRGARALGMRAGRANFKDLHAHFGDDLGLSSDTLHSEPAPMRVEILLDALSKGMEREMSSSVAAQDNEGEFLYTLKPCPECWSRKSSQVLACHGTVGFLQEALEWAGLGDFYQVKQAKPATLLSQDQDNECTFEITRVE